MSEELQAILEAFNGASALALYAYIAYLLVSLSKVGIVGFLVLKVASGIGKCVMYCNDKDNERLMQDGFWKRMYDELKSGSKDA